MDPRTLRAGGEDDGCGPLFRLGDVVAAAGGLRLAGDPELPLRGVAVDTRAVRAGDLFCALRGERVDAHRLLPEALAAGAAAVLVDRWPGSFWSLEELPPGRGAVWVPAVTSAIGRLAAAHLARLRARGGGPRVSAVTGSVGKTGTRLLMAAALGAAGDAVLAGQDSFNTEITVPLVCLRARPAHRFAALELAMRGRGQIAHLAGICRPEVGVLTVIGESHLEALGSVEAIVAAKGELVEALPRHGVAVLNADDPRQQALGARAPCVVRWYGTGAGAEVRATAIEASRDGTRFEAWVRGRRLQVSLALLGRHQVHGALAALACADAMGVDPEAAAAALTAVPPPQSRLQLRACGVLQLLDDAYNAAPQSAVAALETLQLLAPPGQRAAVLGDMRELGAATAAGHAAVGRSAAGAGLRWLLTVGPLAAEIARSAVEAGMPAAAVHPVATRSEAADLLPGLLAPGLTVLVKGSRAVGLEETAERIAQWGEARAAGGP
jgi:UDP-N-acetylmuramoyl-tripeptide--D-alanyl-D-alanine ligase